MEYNRTVVSSTLKNGNPVSQMVIYRDENSSITRHERVFIDDKGNIKILSKKGSAKWIIYLI